MSSFVYDIPTRVYFGPNQLGNLGAELSAIGKKVLLCYGGGSIKKGGLYNRVVAQIKEARYYGKESLWRGDSYGV